VINLKKFKYIEINGRANGEFGQIFPIAVMDSKIEGGTA
jgi:hypothetical protein